MDADFGKVAAENGKSGSELDELNSNPCLYHLNKHRSPWFSFVKEE